MERERYSSDRGESEGPPREMSPIPPLSGDDEENRDEDQRQPEPPDGDGDGIGGGEPHQRAGERYAEDREGKNPVGFRGHTKKRAGAFSTGSFQDNLTRLSSFSPVASRRRRGPRVSGPCRRSGDSWACYVRAR